ncbi:MAG: LL-diaminopimelate aminotransferase [Spirochaetales bacterium]|nr:LL-diaminopimelate aminotransferase [Spirochaetales bacterium]
MEFMHDKIASRLGGLEFGEKTEIYKFEKIKRLKTAARASHPGLPLIDLGVGEPDRPADRRIVDVLSEEAGKPENRFYSDNGIDEFKEAACGYLERVFGVTGLVPGIHCIHGIGSKPILAMLPLCIVDPGDVTITTVPGYPVLATYTRYLGGEVYTLPLLEKNDWYPDLDSIPHHICRRAKVLVINYPNNPTGQVATTDFYRRVVAFARRYGIVVVADAAYAALTFGDTEPLSFLSVEGAMEVGLEIHSLSKAFNMTGWRLAFVAGNPRLVSAYGTVKDNTDSGQFRAIQKAGIYALGHPELIAENRERYSRRFDLLVRVLNEAGFTARKPKASFYCYVKAPAGTASGKRFSNAEEASAFMLRNALVSCVPWDDAGAYLRMSVTFEAEGHEEEKRVMESLGKRLSGLNLVFDDRY